MSAVARAVAHDRTAGRTGRLPDVRDGGDHAAVHEVARGTALKGERISYAYPMPAVRFTALAGMTRFGKVTE
jgi:hypothetical protein